MQWIWSESWSTSKTTQQNKWFSVDRSIQSTIAPTGWTAQLKEQCNKNGSWEQLAVMVMEYTEEQLKYQMDKKAWHSHTSTAALTPQSYNTSGPH